MQPGSNSRPLDCDLTVVMETSSERLWGLDTSEHSCLWTLGGNYITRLVARVARAQNLLGTTHSVCTLFNLLFQRWRDILSHIMIPQNGDIFSISNFSIFLQNLWSHFEFREPGFLQRITLVLPLGNSPTTIWACPSQLKPKIWLWKLQFGHIRKCPFLAHFWAHFPIFRSQKTGNVLPDPPGCQPNSLEPV